MKKSSTYFVETFEDQKRKVKQYKTAPFTYVMRNSLMEHPHFDKLKEIQELKRFWAFMQSEFCAGIKWGKIYAQTRANLADNGDYTAYTHVQMALAALEVAGLLDVAWTDHYNSKPYVTNGRCELIMFEFPDLLEIDMEDFDNWEPYVPYGYCVEEVDIPNPLCLLWGVFVEDELKFIVSGRDDEFQWVNMEWTDFDFKILIVN